MAAALTLTAPVPDPAYSSPVPGRITSGSPVHVAGNHRITPAEVDEAYRLIRCETAFDTRLEVDERTGSTLRACPLYVVAIRRGSIPRTLLGVDESTLSHRMGIEVAYACGHLDGWFGEPPMFSDDDLYRQGWRDGADCYAHACGR